jgi:hypothetical protein
MQLTGYSGLRPRSACHGGQKMSTQRRSSDRVAILLCAFLTFVPVVARQELQRDARLRMGTIQSELDYLRAAEVRISIELTQVTIRQAYDEIARKAEFTIAYEGALNGGSKRDLSFKDMPLKELLGKLGETFNVTYRVDAPAKLTVIGAKPS